MFVVCVVRLVCWCVYVVSMCVECQFVRMCEFMSFGCVCLACVCVRLSLCVFALYGVCFCCVFVCVCVVFLLGIV